MNWFAFAIISAISTSISNLVTKKVLTKAHSLQVAAAAMIVNAFLVLLFIPKVNFDIDLKVLFLLLLSSLLATISYLYCLKAYRHMDISVVSPLFNVGTLITVFLAILIFKESLSINQLFGSLLLIFGAYLINFEGKDIFFPFKELIKSKNYHHLVVSIVGYSVLAVLIKIVLEYISPITYLFFEIIFAAIFMLLYVFIYHDGIRDIKKGFTAANWLIIVIAVAGICDYYFWFNATSIGPVSLVVPVLRLWTLFTVILGGYFFKEKKTDFRLVSCLIMLAGVFIIAL